MEWANLVDAGADFLIGGIITSAVVWVIGFLLVLGLLMSASRNSLSDNSSNLFVAGVIIAVLVLGSVAPHYFQSAL